jgi:hypothetical protein
MENNKLDHITKDSKEYAKLVVKAYAGSPKKKKHTPFSRIKIPLRDLEESTFVARLVGEMSAGERVLQTIRDEMSAEGFESAEEFRDTLLGELQIFVLELNNMIARMIKKENLSVTLEDLIERDVLLSSEKDLELNRLTGRYKDSQCPH